MHPGHGLFVLGVDGAVVDLAAIVRVGVEVIQAAEGGAEVPQAGHIVGAEGDLIVGAVAVQVGGLDQMPVVLPVLQGHGALNAQLFQPVGADDVGHIAGDLLIQHGHIINIAVAVSQCFFDTVPLVDLLLQVGHVVLDVIVQGQDHAGLAVFQHLGGGHIHNDIRQLSIHHHKVQALVVVVLRGIIKFKIHIEFFAQDLPDIHLLGSNLVCALDFRMRTVIRSLEAAAPEPAAEEVVEEELPQPSRTPNAREATIALHTARLLIFLSFIKSFPP